MRVEMYIDLKKNDPVWNTAMLDCREGGGIWASNRPQQQTSDDVRIKVTVQLPDKYFVHSFNEIAHVVDVQVIE